MNENDLTDALILIGERDLQIARLRQTNRVLTEKHAQLEQERAHLLDEIKHRESEIEDLKRPTAAAAG